jgi:3-hydroxyacyl-[acyl-carrier-protein] dehydratase
MRFLLVDRIVALERGKRAVGFKNVTMSEDFLTHHFPDRPIMPGTLIIEALVQLADWLVRENSDFTYLGLATTFGRLKFRRVVRPGDRLRLEVEITSLDVEAAEVKGKAYREDELAASGTFTLALHPLEGYLSVAEARQLFGMIYDGEDPQHEK